MKMKKKKRFLSVLLILCMSLMTFPMTVLAEADDIEVKDATYYASGALQNITVNFNWDTAGATGRLVLMTKQLRSAGTEGTDNFYGDFTDLGTYGDSFSSFDEVLSYDQSNGTFGILAYSAQQDFQMHANNEMSISLDETAISLREDNTYYVYLWTFYRGQYYPDNLFCVIRVENGAVKYAAATGRNSFDESALGNVGSTTQYTVSITPTANMTRNISSGEEVQNNLNQAMTPVEYTANDGYYFPEDYAVATVNGIMVRRDSDKKITVYGTPSADAQITLTEPSRENVPLENITFGYAYDVQRSPAYPVGVGSTVELFMLWPPLLGDGTHKDVSTGDWTLTKAGTYSVLKDTNKGTLNLDSVVRDVAEAYGLSSEEKEKIVIYELMDGNVHVAYGVVIVYDTEHGYVVFIGDNLGGGAGYLLSTESVTADPVTVTSTKIATDFVSTIDYKISLNVTGAYIFSDATVGYGTQTPKEVTVENSGNGETGELTVALSGINADSFMLSKSVISSIPVGDSSTFTVVPVDGLTCGTYTATVSVSGGNISAASFDVTFTVCEAGHTCSPVLVPAESPTCTTPGKRAYYHCNDCSKNYEDAFATIQIVDISVWGNIPALEHTASDWKFNDDGHWQVCTATECGEIVEGSWSAHSYGNDDTCDVCGYTRDLSDENDDSSASDDSSDETVDSPISDDSADETADSPVTSDSPDAATPAYVIHIVQKGDNLWKIARRYGCTVAEIMTANNDVIKDANLIYPGCPLNIPQNSGNPDKGNTQQEADLPNAGNSRIYIVKRGDTLWAIAKKYGCTSAEIIALNSRLAANPDLIYAGWELIIPD